MLDLETKHVAYDSTQKNKDIIKQGKDVGYDYVLFGTHRGKWKDDNERLSFEVERIKSMTYSTESRPIKVVIGSSGKIFIDNTHWALAYVLRYGKDVKLNQVPFYIVDFRQNIPQIIDIKNSVIKNDVDITRAVNSAGKIEQRVQKGWRKNNTSSLAYLHDELTTWY